MKTISSLLIANRGEIAIRLMASAKKMGIKTYAIKTAKEPKALYLRFADEIIDLTEQEDEIPEFLDVHKLVNTAKQHGIDAIHPGYGFLSENPYFAEKCAEEGIVFVGPSAESIFRMGNKTIAKQIAKKHGIPMLEGSTGSVESEAEAIKIAAKIGYPIILKAASGGGGRGMRIVESEKDLGKMYRTAKNEAEKAFADSSVFIERYVRNPKHIEFQIVADKHGNIVHLGERECSVQRKHQKLIEEAPSPALTPELRERMGAEAIKLAKAVGYYSVGTVEFLLDASGSFFFMEMNTRIQVEHPVTEEVTGVDLVELMLRIANGETLPIKQEDVKINGWAIECRLNAEDVQANFAPNTGLIERLVFPKGKNIRIETGVESGSMITPHFDSMIAKLICTGETREKTIANSLAALDKFHIQGLKTTVPFCKAVLTNPAFASGEYNTSFIGKDLKVMYQEDADSEMVAAFFAAFEYAREYELHMSPNASAEDQNINPWLLNKRMKSL